MEKLKKYQAAIFNILEDYSKVRYSNLDAENKLITDKENHHYLILTIGWEGKRFIHDCPIHMDIINNKVWIQRNVTELDLGALLMNQGVLQSDIVLGFPSPSTRKYSDFAVA